MRFRRPPSCSIATRRARAKRRTNESPSFGLDTRSRQNPHSPSLVPC
jgi:hypothetical protein